MLTPLMYGPVDTTRMHSREFFTSPELLQNDCQVDLVMVSLQFPADPAVPLGTLPGQFLSFLYK